MAILATLQRIALIENHSVPGLNRMCTPLEWNPKARLHVTDEKSTEIATRVVPIPINVKTIESEPMMRWIGLKTVVNVILEEHEVAGIG